MSGLDDVITIPVWSVRFPTCGEVVGISAFDFHGGHFPAASFFGDGAARMKWAARWGIGRAGHFALQYHAVLFAVHLGLGHGGKQGLRIRMFGIAG